MSFLKECSKFYKETLVKNLHHWCQFNYYLRQYNWKVCHDRSGSVVTKDIPDFAKIIGNPGRIIGWVDKKGSPIKFEDSGKSQCGNYYNDGKLHEI